MKTYEITYSNGGIYSANMVIAESADQATAYYTTAEGHEVVGCTETMCRPKPGQPVVTVPEGWTAPAAEPETTETAERAAEINPMCTDCTRRGAGCDGTTCMTWTGCVYRKTTHRSAAELAAERRARGRAVCKRDLLALTGGGCKPLRWACIRYKLSFYGLDPYDMGAELMAEGVEIIYDNTAITRAENAAERRRVQRAYAAREGARA